MKPVYLTEKDIPQEVKDKIVNEQIEINDKKKALDKFIQRDVLFEQELATSDDPLKIKDLLRIKQKELNTEIKIKEWALLQVGAWEKVVELIEMFDLIRIDWSSWSWI